MACEYLHLAVGYNVECSGCCGNEYRLSLTHLHLLAVVVGYCTFAFGAYYNYERVERRKLNGVCLCEVVECCSKVGARYKLGALVVGCRVVCAVVVLHAVVDDSLALLGVQLAGIAVGIYAVEVVYAVGDVRCLLNLGDECACSNGVYASGGKEEEVARVYVILGQEVGDGVVGNACLVLLGGYLLCKARAQ